MAEAEHGSVLKRKVAAGQDGGGARRIVSPARALGQAFSRAAEEEFGLALVAHGSTARLASLAELLEMLPEGGLLAVLEGPGEAQGLMALDGPFLAAVIEKQTTGALSPAPPQPRRPTRTDAALTADLIDAVLRAFEAPLAGRAEGAWASGFGYATYLDDPRPLGLLLEDVEYRLLSVTADLESGTREGRALLALPAEGRAPVVPAGDAAGPAPAATAQGGGTVTPADPRRWPRALEAHVLAGEVRIEAELHRLSMPLVELERLAVGDTIPIPVEAIDETRLVAADGTVLGRGRLGQKSGHRAVRLAADRAADAPPAGLPSADAPPPPPAEPEPG